MPQLADGPATGSVRPGSDTSGGTGTVAVFRTPQSDAMHPRYRFDLTRTRFACFVAHWDGADPDTQSCWCPRCAAKQCPRYPGMRLVTCQVHTCDVGVRGTHSPGAAPTSCVSCSIVQPHPFRLWPAFRCCPTGTHPANVTLASNNTSILDVPADRPFEAVVHARSSRHRLRD